ncbi:MAG: hypothetical protein WD048_16750 [Chitinophagales bacterium]
MKVKEDFHKLIDNINDEEVLLSYFKLIQSLNKNQAGNLWNTLSSEEKKDLLLSYEESLNPDQLISHDSVKKSD